VRAAALRDVEALAEGGVHGIIVENFGDAPFFPGRVPAHVLACMTELVGEVRRRVKDLPVGVNVLRNDGCAALAVAHACGASFIRVNVLCGARATDQGIIQGIAHELLRERGMLRAEHVKILADVDVKHSAALAARPIEEEVVETIDRGLADAIIVSGAGTGLPTGVEKARRVKAVAGNAPVFVGSGVTVRTVDQYLPHADGFIVGTSVKVDGNVSKPVDPARVRELVRAVG
jgi:membrane complex biogenesis BtpA family protein